LAPERLDQGCGKERAFGRIELKINTGRKSQTGALLHRRKRKGASPELMKNETGNGDTSRIYADELETLHGRTELLSVTGNKTATRFTENPKQKSSDSAGTQQE
jgi:hypothetical protein